MSDHTCNQGARFDNIERTLGDIHETLKKLTDLLISQAQAQVQIQTLESSSKDHEIRIRSLEDRSAASRWIERLSWAGLVGVVGAYFKIKSGG